MKVFNERGALVVDFEVTKMENLVFGLDASKSASPEVGRVYVATDTGILYICFIAGTWSQSTKIKNLVSGLDINKPASPAVGDAYIATDSAIFYVCYVAENWTQVGGQAESAYFSKAVYYTMFNSLDFIDILNNVTLDTTQGLKLNRDAGEVTAIILRPSVANKSSKFASQCVFPVTASSLACLAVGGHPLDDGEPHYGFVVDNWPTPGTIWASNGNGGGGGTQVKTEIIGYTISSLNHYKAVFTAGSKIEFYVNGNLEVTHTTYLPTISMPIGRFNVGSAAGIMYVRWYAFEEEL